MSKVGILSMQRIKNYGSFLQAYALKKMLEKLGHEVEFVDYHIEEPIIKTEDNSKNDKISKAIKAIKGDEPLIQKFKYILHKKNFGKKYYKLLNLTSEPNYTPRLDTLIIGSDEVFNCIQENKNVGYSLELFGKNNNAKKVITYAASFGNTTLEKIKKFGKEKEIGELISKLDTISVRDNNSGKIVEKLTNKKVIYNLDPVLAYDYIDECEFIPDIEIKEKYMIVYAYSGRISTKESDYIKEYAKKNNLKVYSIGGAQKCADKFIDCSPFEVLAYFKNAELIVTDTFHGSIFSIITHSNFVTLVRKSVGNAYGNEEKLTDLLERLKLKDRIIYNIEEMEKKLNDKISYADVQNLINIERNKSIEYLEKETNTNKQNAINKTKKDCCGCGACADICPKNAITMLEDEYGFIYPKIDKEKCIDCGACRRICAYNQENNSNYPLESYAAILKDKQQLKKSASGGVFIGIATEIIKKGGIVFGCSLEKKEGVFEPKHIAITKLENLYKLQGSKYVQSSTSGIFLEVRKELLDNKVVLFSGTPCQVAALKRFLGKDYSNLYTIDIICHGVPSARMFKDYINFLEEKNKSKIIDFKFRDKSKGWGLFYKVVFEDGRIISEYSHKSSYYQMFLDSQIYRENCYSCPYAQNNRIGEITIGDFWGFEKEHLKESIENQIDVKEGISCVMVNNQKGKKLLENYCPNLKIIASDYEKIKKRNHQLNYPSIISKERKKILCAYKGKKYAFVEKMYIKRNFIKNMLKNIIKK